MSITPNNDYKDLLRELNDAGVDYLVVGAHAVAAYGFARFTQDFAVVVRPTQENAARVYRALGNFGAPLKDVKVADFTEPDLIYQIGVAPVRIDILTEIDGIDFDHAWSNRLQAMYDGEPMNIISRQDLLTNKRASGRKKDLDDVEALEKLGPLD